MLWIGGGPGAGKSILAWRLSRATDLPLHPVDLWTYDHQARLPARDSPDEELARGPVAAADAFESVSRSRLELVLDDIWARELGHVPAIVEGPQLMPALASRLPAGCGVWILPDPVRTRLARAERLAREESLAGRRVTGRSRMGRLLERDALLTERIRATAAAQGRPVVEVPPTPDWSAIAAAVESALGPALRSAPRLSPGSELSRQRRHENGVAERQGRLWARDAGLTAKPTYPFGCECGQSGCRATWMTTPDDYALAAAAGQRLIAHDR
jgi:hypothetical protein